MRSSSLRSLSLVAALCALTAPRADALRVVTYNILNYSSGRTAEFQTVLAELDADVLVVQEVLSQGGVDTFASTILDVVAPGEWTAGDFVNGADTDNAIYYKPATVQYLSHVIIGTTLRDIDEWTIRPVGYTSSDANVRLYVVHLKASQGSTNEQRRLDEVEAMRVHMETFPSGQHYAVLGDFNIYTSAEPAYQYMLGTSGGLAGVVEDPIDEPGNWHNSSAFADIHTQSPRTTQFGGGANGGMDDRFDMILVSPALNDGEGFDVLPSTYEAFGQDGQHFNGSLADPPYVVVSQTVAEAIHDASDHLPVLVDVQVPSILVAGAALDFGTVILGGPATETLSVANGATVPGDDLDYDLSAPAGFGAPTGPFSAPAGSAPNAHDVIMSTATAGPLAGDLTITSDAPDAPSASVALSGTVLDHAAPSIEAGSVVVAGAVDFGTHAPGEFADVPVEAHNVGHDVLQALLEVYEAEVTDEPRFSIDFAPETVGAVPASWDVSFDAAGAPSGTYEGTLTLRTRDQQDLAGATPLADLVFALTAEVTGAVDVAAVPPAVTTGIHRIAPNPFRPRTAVAFGLSAPERVALDVFDVAGRHVRALARGTRAAGPHTAAWDGRDGAGADVGAGIFYVRLVAGAHRETRILVRLK